MMQGPHGYFRRQYSLSTPHQNSFSSSIFNFISDSLEVGDIKSKACWELFEKKFPSS